MPKVARSKTPRLGRPPASSATETRQRILEVACDEFSTRGYGVTTNKDVAAKAGITTGALYYYFDSKLDMYLAVFRDMQAKIDKRFAEATAGKTTFDGQLRAILESAHELNVHDPSFARFQGVARVDRLRHPELLEAIPNPPGEGASLTGRLIALGLETGEIAPGRERQVEAVLRVIFVGLVDALSQDPVEQRLAIDGIEALLDGDLVGPPLREATKTTGEREAG